MTFPGPSRLEDRIDAAIYALALGVVLAGGWWCGFNK